MGKGMNCLKFNYFNILAICMHRFSVSDSFVGFQEDTPSSVVLHVSNIIKEQDEKQVFNKEIKHFIIICKLDT